MLSLLKKNETILIKLANVSVPTSEQDSREHAETAQFEVEVEPNVHVMRYFNYSNIGKICTISCLLTVNLLSLPRTFPLFLSCASSARAPPPSFCQLSRIFSSSNYCLLLVSKRTCSFQRVSAFKYFLIQQVSLCVLFEPKLAYLFWDNDALNFSSFQRVFLPSQQVLFLRLTQSLFLA